MIEVHEEENQKVKAILVGEPNVSLSELKGLCSTLEIEVLRSINLLRMEPTPSYGIGRGKAEEICALAKELGADAIIFDYILEPRKQRNWEKLSHLAVFDRQEVILRIFASRAKTKEAVLQVQLAKLEYSLPRLAHMYGDLARQRGGNYGSKGRGETQLELDQRQVRQKIAVLKNELNQVVKDRLTQKKRRSKIPFPSCAIIGYTNAGKSTLLNAMTGSETLVEDKLFATLDPTTRQLKLKEGSTILLTDTVGFISNLPHSLVNAFKSTLEEAKTAELQLIVLDSSDENVFDQYRTVLKVLEEIDAQNSKRLIVLNKSDLLSEENAHSIKIEQEFSGAIKISAKNKTGFDELKEKIMESILGEIKEFVIQKENSSVLSEIRKKGVLVEELWLEDGIHIKARLPIDYKIKNLC